MNGSSILTNQEPQGHDLQPQVYTHSTNTTSSSSSIPQSFTNTSSSVNTRVFDSSMSLDHDLYYYKGMYSEEDDIPKRRIRIDRLECIGMDREKGQLSFSCTCSTGTYIRVLGYEIGHLLEVCGAYVVELYRSRIGSLSTMLRLKILEMNELSQ
ncbi:hypothetical protein C9374_008928 [Naegleria lovaniensis]|uniref:tRNA pseudouridine(55) synthase n=1 Tax=Naegleria lovaniensis TaxID=51637 RepID=A0AA88GKK8_NAELO|nr:uncharacterized protein C9374_008928 [Naegleria lovaniensis]KAG2377843.1 hypothetical protein C9374_008928 [Naegleria lovaniensis]